MRWLMLLLIVSITFPVTAQEGPEFEELIQRSLTLESPDPGEREEVEKRFRDVWPKLLTLCVCGPVPRRASRFADHGGSEQGTGRYDSQHDRR